MSLLVITSTELGWDCVCAVYPNTEENWKKVQLAYTGPTYVTTEISLSDTNELDELILGTI